MFSRCCQRLIKTILHDKRGATTTEYALILALVVIVLIGTLTTLGSVLNTKLDSIVQSIRGV